MQRWIDVLPTQTDTESELRQRLQERLSYSQATLANVALEPESLSVSPLLNTHARLMSLNMYQLTCLRHKASFRTL